MLGIHRSISREELVALYKCAEGEIIRPSFITTYRNWRVGLWYNNLGGYVTCGGVRKVIDW